MYDNKLKKRWIKITILRAHQLNKTTGKPIMKRRIKMSNAFDALTCGAHDFLGSWGGLDGAINDEEFVPCVFTVPFLNEP